MLVYGIEIKSTDGTIRFVKAKHWDREKIDQQTVKITTEDKPIARGSNKIVLLIVENKWSPLEWRAFGTDETTQSSVC